MASKVGQTHRHRIRVNRHAERVRRLTNQFDARTRLTAPILNHLAGPQQTAFNQLLDEPVHRLLCELGLGRDRRTRDRTRAANEVENKPLACNQRADPATLSRRACFMMW
ncbi:hypothetical protein [Paraburkholderia sp. BR14374]|uniref:hypothetical protein n=1 Tax=Paraburkholderia sp. BR14374 TaxID=3237007 RepID=UPI0034CD268F